MNPGYCGFFDEPETAEETEPQNCCTIVPDEDGVCFIDNYGITGRSWIETNLTVALEDVR